MSDVAIALEALQTSIAASGRGVVGAVGTVDDAAHAAWHGKRVLVGMFDACGECDVCRRGGAPVCPRGVRRELAAGATHVRAAERWLIALGDGLELPGPAAAAVPGDVALAYTLYARTGVAPRDPVVVVGDDSVARFLVAILRAKGVAPVVLAELAPGPDGDVVAVGDAIAALAQDPNAGKPGGRPWRVIATRELARAAALAGPRATLTVLTGAAGADGTALAAALAREVSVLGVRGPHPDLVLEAAALVAKGELDLASGVVVRRADDPAPRDATRSDIVTLGALGAPTA